MSVVAASAHDPSTSARRPAVCQPRRPERSVVYQVVQKHLETGLEMARAGDGDEQSVPAYIEHDSRQYLTSGILANGFSRPRCAHCCHDFLLAFSCKGCAGCCTRGRPRVPCRKNLAALRALPVPHLKELAGRRISQLGQQAVQRGLLPQSEARRWSDREVFEAASEPVELETIVMIEYLKQLMGKPYLVNLREVLSRR